MNVAKISSLLRSVVRKEPHHMMKSEGLPPPTTEQKKYVVISQLDSGGFSKVLLVRRRYPTAKFSFSRSTDICYAAKVCKIKEGEEELGLPEAEDSDSVNIGSSDTLSTDYGFTQPLQLNVHKKAKLMLEADIVQEIDVMRRLQGKNKYVVKLVDTLFVLDKDTASKEVWIVMEKMTLNFEEFIQSCRYSRNYLKQQKLAICYDILQGVAYLKSKRIIHRDLKPSNVLLSATSGLVKLCDFGISQIVPAGQTSCVVQNRFGTPQYAAPELWILGCEYDYAVDVWAFGAIMYAAFYHKGGLYYLNPECDYPMQFMKSEWEAYAEGELNYWSALMGGGTMSKAESCEYVGVAEDSDHWVANDEDYAYFRANRDVIMAMRGCLVPYPTSGPEDVNITRTDLKERMEVHELMQHEAFTSVASNELARRYLVKNSVSKLELQRKQAQTTGKISL